MKREAVTGGWAGISWKDEKEQDREDYDPIYVKYEGYR